MKTVVMTGGTSGLGREAAEIIAQAEGIRLLLGVRSDTMQVGESLALDLASLSSVRAFARAVSDQLAGTPIDAMVLNAGAQFGNLHHRTPEGFETTFAVNHLAHYLLLRLLTLNLARQARVVITTSDAHDPKVNPMAPKGLDPAQLAQPPAKSGKGFTAGFRAYSASKLCNLLTARAFANSEEARRLDLTVIAYSPGLGLSDRERRSSLKSKIHTKPRVGALSDDFEPGGQLHKSNA